VFQPESETLPRAELEELQLGRLRATLHSICANNPRYAARFAGSRAEDVHTLEDLRRFPLLTKEDLRRGYPFDLVCAPPADFARIHMSSGTTGVPIICPHTAQDVTQWGEIMARCLSAAGVGPDDIIQITPSFGLFNGGFGFHYGASALGTMIIPIGPGRTQLQLKFMRDLGSTVLAAIASYPLRLIEVAAGEGFDFRRDSKLRVGIFGAEIWSDELRRRIEQQIGIETFDIIGMTETAGVGMGIDCAEHDGIHIWEDHYLVEVVDWETAEPLPDGEWGELVVTTLTRQALPLIRYRTHDITRVLSRDPCRCGRTSLRLERFSCRTDDMLKVKGVNLYPKQIESLFLSHPEIGNDYLIVIDRVEGADHLAVNVESRELRWPDSLGHQLSDELYNMLGLHAEVSILQPGALPRPEGKAVRVDDRR